MAVALLAVSSGKSPCFVQSTYRQEFLSKVVANPFYSSSHIVKQGPRSIYEVLQNVSLPYKQQASDIGIFPIIPFDPLHHASFWVVEPLPTATLLVGGVSNILPPGSMADGVYYLDEATQKVFANGVPSTGGTGPILANMALQSISGPIKVGSMLPNIARCIKPLPSNPQPSDVEHWLATLRRVASNSHLRGTCLLTGQQATVDVTSNFKTSITVFSSVNLLFMLAVVMWISASFALFYVGGLPSSYQQQQQQLLLEDAAAAAAAAPSSSCIRNWSSTDFFVLAGIAWNAVLVVYVLIPSVQDSSSIPLNNVVVSLMALLAAIAVQWYWAYYSGKDGSSSSSSVSPAAAASRGSVAPVVAAMNKADSAAAAAAAASLRDGGADSVHFNTRNFLSVASSMQQQQQQRSRLEAMMTSDVPLAVSSMMRLGLPFAAHNYYRAIKDQLLMDTVQNLEYAITTPLMFAILLASFSPTVPTGMVQLLYLLLLSSNLVCIGTLSTATTCKRMKDDFSEYIHEGSMVMATCIMLGVCYILQISSLVIKLTFFRQLWESAYNVGSLLQATTIMMVVLQILFLVCILLHTTANLTYVATAWSAAGIARWANRMYMTINFLLKFVVGWLAFSTAVDKAFPAYACGIWGNV